MSSGSRVSIPNSLRKMIQNIKEITGNHSDEEIHAMLKECSMDPNETAQRLLLQDPFHEVKRKRDKRKENLNNKETAESKWRPGPQGRGSRGGRGNVSTRNTPHDAGGSRKSAPGKDNGANQVSGRGGAASSSPTSQETKSTEPTPLASSVTRVDNGPTSVSSGSTSIAQASDPPESISANDANSFGTAPPPAGGANKKPAIAPKLSSNPTTTSAPSAGIYSSASNPVLVPSHDSRLPSVVGTIKREVGSQRSSVEPNATVSASAESNPTSTSEVGSFFMQGKMPNKSGVGKNQPTDSSQPSSSIHAVPSVSRPSSNYNTRSLQLLGTQKGGTGKEWKPKFTNPILTQDSGKPGGPEVPAIPVEAAPESTCSLGVVETEASTSKLQRKLENLHFPDGQHVIIPNHIHVPAAERMGLSFGSFDADFRVGTSHVNDPESDRSSTPLSEASQGIEDAVEEQSESNEPTLSNATEGDHTDYQQLPPNVPESLSSAEGDVSAAAVPDYNETKQEAALPIGAHQYSVVHTSPNYSLDFVPPILGSQLAPFETSDSQTRDVSRLPSFVVQPPFDPANYYAQFYRSGADTEGRISPFHTAGVPTKFNANVAILPPQTSQSPQEGGNPLVLSTSATPTPVVTQVAGAMQSSIPVSQQAVPVFRQPTGMHISHYHPNYVPFGHYFSPPFYVPPPTIHQFLSNGVFPQQPQPGSVYPPQPGAATTAVKYSLPQYKTGANTGNSTHIGMPSAYGPYGSTPAGYNPSSASALGNSTANEDIIGSQFKESNVYMTGQQSEGSAVWFAAPGRDISGMQATSFYSLPPQGPHMTFGPTQPSHATFSGIYHHPAQGVSTGGATFNPLLQQSQTGSGAVDMVGPPPSVYQQQQQPPQHTQVNWPNNY